MINPALCVLLRVRAMKRFYLYLLPILLSLLLRAPCAHAETYYVNGATGADGNDGRSEFTAFKTIQQGLDTAQNGDAVLVADGIYKGAGNKDLDFNGKSVTLRSQGGAANCLIDCQATDIDNHRGFYF